jgi:hypothetical protein
MALKILLQKVEYQLKVKYSADLAPGDLFSGMVSKNTGIFLEVKRQEVITAVQDEFL